MFKYVLKRLLYFIPTFFVISLLTFMLGQIAPGDPVELKLKGGNSNQGGLQDKITNERSYNETAKKMGRDLPVFYFSLSTAANPDTLYKIPGKAKRQALERLVSKYGNWEQINTYFQAAKHIETETYKVPKDTLDPDFGLKLRQTRENAQELLTTYDESRIEYLTNAIAARIATPSFTDSAKTQKHYSLASLKSASDMLNADFAKVKEEATPNKTKIPALHWYGLKNQYHRWLFGNKPWLGKSDDPTKTSGGFLRGDFGDSYRDGRPVSSIIKDAIKWTLLLNFIAFIIIYSVSIPMGVSLAVKKGTVYERSLTIINFVLYSLPVFWIGTLFIVFMTNDYYSEALDIFPGHGLGVTGSDYTFSERFIDRTYHLILPMICMVYGGFAYISRQMRGGLLNVIKQDYIRTAYAKGLDSKTVIWKHAFRNSLIPIITMFASFLPAMIGGSVIIETMFTIPGMGQISFASVVERNYPVLFTLLMFSAILTMVGNLLADILYGLVDPRISFSKKA